MIEKKFDLVVIGGGPAGYVAAIRASQLGFRTACVEKRKLLGGTCLNVGCIPSKTLLEITHHYQEANHNFADLGIELAQKAKINIEQMMKKKSEVISGLGAGISMLLKKNKVTHIEGAATILKEGEVAIHNNDSSDKIFAKKILIATGSEVAKIPNIEIDKKSIISSDGALDLKKVPKKMILIGGGVIGLELGSVWGRLGAEIEVIEFMDRICPAMDEEISKNFLRTLKKQGMNFRLKHKVLSANKEKNGMVKVEIENIKSGAKEILQADTVLVAVGRKPYTESLGLKEIGLKTDERGFIEVANNFETNIKNVFAVGDVITGPMLAHKAEEEAVVAVEMMAGQSGHIDYDLIPSVIYTYPEIASVGLTEEQLKKKNIAYKIGKFPMIANSRARATFSDQGFVKILACQTTDKVLGCHIISRDAGNLIHQVAGVMEFGASSEDIARTCHAHPTLNESIKEAALAVDKRQIHS